MSAVDRIQAVGHQRTGILDPMAAFARNLQSVQHAIGRRDGTGGGEHHLRPQRTPGAHLHHVHRAARTSGRRERVLGDGHEFRLGLSRRVGPDDLEHAALVDLHRMPDRGDFLLRFLRPRVIELHVEIDELEAGRGERAVVAHVHDVFHAVHADLARRTALQEIRHPLAAMRRQLAIADKGFAVVPYPGRLARKHRDRIAPGGNHDVGITVQDMESGEVANGALEAGVLAATDDQRVETGGFHRRPHVGVAPVDLVLARAKSPGVTAHCSPPSCLRLMRVSTNVPGP